MCWCHLDYFAAYRQSARSAARAAGRCLWCPRQAGRGRVLCLRCAARGNRVGKLPQAPIRSKVFTADKDGRVRFRGTGKRGFQPKIQMNRQDARFARDELEAGMRGLELAETEEVKAMTKYQQEEVVAAALYHLDLAVGLIEDVLDRMGHFRARNGSRNEEL